MVKKPTPGNDFFKKPGMYIQQVGKYTAAVEMRDANNLPKTSAAMDEVAKAKYRDDLARNAGIDDYTLSLEKLFSAFDAFIREYSKGRHTAGSPKIYDYLSKPHHLTILLLWKIRNVWTHVGGIIDNKCKREYEEIIGDAYKKGIKPRIDLPLVIPINFKFSIDFNNYLMVEQCIFEYIGEKIPKKDLKILAMRSSIANITIRIKRMAHFHIPQGDFLIDLDEALHCGCSMDPVSKEFTIPSDAIYDGAKKRIILKASGKSFYAEKLPNN